MSQQTAQLTDFSTISETAGGVAPPAITVGLLGEFSVRRGDQPLVLPPSTRRLVALLALERRLWSRSRVCGVLWADHDELRAHANLRTVLWRLRQCEPSLVEVAHAGLRLSAAVLVDVHQVETLARGLGHDAMSDLVSVDPRVFGQELLPEWTDVFVDLYRESCRQQGLHALENLARRLLGVGETARALQAGLAAVVQAPLRESAHRVVMEIHLTEGNVAEALRQLDVYSQTLWEQLGLLPSPDLRDLLVAEATP
jgi:DNA-binding SARP family transcriptional activator